MTRTLKSWLGLRGSDAEATSAAGVCRRMAYSPKGRELLFSDELVEPLVKLLSVAGAPCAPCGLSPGLGLG